MRVERELMRGAGPVAVLRLLSTGERYGYELVQLLDARSAGVLAMGQSTLYPLLYNLQAKGLIASRVESSESGRPRKYYRLTDKGKKRLAKEQKQWQALSAAMGQLGILGELTMADSIEPGWVTRLRFTPLSELLRGDLNGRLHWRHVIASADLLAPIAQLVFRIVKRTRLWNRERRAVAEELVAHFQDGLAAGESVAHLIERFGDEHAATKLIRRATKRNRPLIWHAWKYSSRGLYVILLTYALFFARFLLSKPTISVDYLAELNAPNEAVAPQDRAWPIYRQAILALNIASINEDKLLKQSFGQTEDGGEKHLLDLTPNDSAWPQLTRWLDVHSHGLQLVREAAAKPALGFILGPDGSQRDPELGWNRENNHVISSINVLLPALHPFRQMAAILRADGRYAQSRGDGARALLDIEAIFGIAAQQRDPIIVTSMVRMGINWLAFAQIQSLLREHPGLLSNEQLTQLAHRVVAVGGDTASSLIDLSGEQAVFHDIIQRIYSDNGHGDGRLTRDAARVLPELEGLADSNKAIDYTMPFIVLGAISPIGSRHDILNEYDRGINLLSAAYARPLRDPYAQDLIQRNKSRLNEIKSSLLLQIRYAPMAMFASAFSNLPVSAEKLLGRRDGIELGLALEIYHRQQGHYPQTLNELTTIYLPAVPVDRITGDPLKYRLVEGRPVVYSVGVDRKDDGGRAPVGRDKKPDPDAAASWPLPSSSVVPPDGDWVVFDMRTPTATTHPTK